MAYDGASGDAPLNLIWFVVDSVRNYRSGGDDRDKLDVMYKMSSECVDFETVVTTAPSTLMSGSTMMTGCPSYLIGRDYENFHYDKATFTSLGEILKRRGYFTSGAMWFLHSRQRLGGRAIDLADRRYWPRGLKFGRSWTNDEVSHIYNKQIDDGLPEPFFLLVWYNCRGDPNTSAMVERDLQRLRDDGSFDRSVFLMSSDHGYPDPSRGMGPQWFARQGLTHDLVLTDDNILVPLLVHYPGCKPRKVTTPVSTMDLMPTILELMNISADSEETKHIRGKSLVPLMEGRPAPELEGRVFRSDARFLMQTHRATAIRSTNYKYIVHHDAGAEEFYDIKADPSESRNLIEDADLQPTIADHRHEFERSEQEAVDFHLRYLLERTGTFGANLNGHRSVLVIYGEEIPNGDLLLRALASVFSGRELHLLTGYPLDESATQGFSSISEWTLSEDGIPLTPPQLPRASYDMVVLPAAVRSGALYAAALALGRRLSRRYPLVIDPNLTGVTQPSKSPLLMLKVANERKGLYVKEPGLVLRDIRNALARLMPGLISKARGRRLHSDA